MHRSTTVIATLGLLAALALSGCGDATPPTTAPKVNPEPTDASADSTASRAMLHMQTMHEQMMAAKTPAERQALMADHMKAMQEGMDAMQHMGKASKESGAMGMGTRMDMMAMMMQMMMDRQQMSGMGGMGMGGMGSSPPERTPPANPTK
jgi:hypothetical protein